MLDELSVEVNRTLTFQRHNQKLQYRPENIFVRDIVIGLRPKNSDGDWIGYIECKVWNIGSQKENVFWNYANAVEKDKNEKPFLAVCNYIKMKNTSKKNFIVNMPMMPMSGWAVYVSELSVYEDAIIQYPELSCSQIEAELLEIIPKILQHSFFIRPAYIFVSDMEIQQDVLVSADFKKIGTINEGKISLFMKSCK